MKIKIQFVNMKTSETMYSYVVNQLNKLSKKYNWIISASVFLKKENDATEKGHICEIELSESGPRLFAASDEKNYELAVKNTISDLEKQLKKRKAIMKPYM